MLAMNIQCMCSQNDFIGINFVISNVGNQSLFDNRWHWIWSNFLQQLKRRLNRLEIRDFVSDMEISAQICMLYFCKWLQPAWSEGAKFSPIFASVLHRSSVCRYHISPSLLASSNLRSLDPQISKQSLKNLKFNASWDRLLPIYSAHV